MRYRHTARASDSDAFNVAGWKKDSRNTYVNAREECEGNLKVLIVRMKAEIVEAAEGEKA